MASEILIHIGTEKTASSAMQHGTRQVADPLRARGVHVPLDELPHRFVAHHMRPSSPAYGRALRIVEVWRRAVAEPWPRQVVLSSESLIRQSEAEVRGLLQAIDASPERVTVLCYVRRPSAHWLSLCMQELRVGPQFRSPTEGYGFREGLESWARVVPRVLVRPFERSQLEDGEPLADFVARGIAPVVPEVTELTFPGKWRNRGLTAEAAVLLQRLQAHYLSAPEFIEAPRGAVLMRRLKKLRQPEDTRAALKPEVARWIDDAHGEDLAWLRDEHGVRFDGWSPPSAAEISEARARLSDPDLSFLNMIQGYRPERVESLALDLILDLAFQPAKGLGRRGGRRGSA